MNSSDIIIVGGLPEPIGGVTNFIKRVASHNMVSDIIDCYPSCNKYVPSGYVGNVVYLNSIIHFVFYYFLNFNRWKSKVLHFNFSRARSLWLFFLLPKFGAQFQLMLHHGSLKISKVSFFYSFILKRFDVVYSLSPSQEKFYLNNKVDFSKIRNSSSYVKPLFSDISVQKKKLIDAFFDDGLVAVTSGRPDSIYNHIWNINFFQKHHGCKLALFIYGDGDCCKEIENLVNSSPKMKIFYNFKEEEFLYALSKANVYSRPAKIDSFGIAVADAVELGCLVLTSDVCERYPGAYIYSPNTYSSFSNSMNKLISGNVDCLKVSDSSFVPFKYER